MKLQPDAFPRYQDNANSLSALVNKGGARAQPLPNGESLYPLGHMFKEPPYGFGWSQEVLEKIAVKPPAVV